MMSRNLRKNGLNSQQKGHIDQKSTREVKVPPRCIAAGEVGNTVRGVLHSAAVAVLVLFAGAAGARVIAADAGAVVDAGHVLLLLLALGC